MYSPVQHAFLSPFSSPLYCVFCRAWLNRQGAPKGPHNSPIGRWRPISLIYTPDFLQTRRLPVPGTSRNPFVGIFQFLWFFRHWNLAVCVITILLHSLPIASHVLVDGASVRFGSVPSHISRLSCFPQHLFSFPISRHFYDYSIRQDGTVRFRCESKMRVFRLVFVWTYVCYVSANVVISNIS